MLCILNFLKKNGKILDKIRMAFLTQNAILNRENKLQYYILNN